jgi:hypothetical protein
MSFINQLFARFNRPTAVKSSTTETLPTEVPVDRNLFVDEFIDDLSPENPVPQRRKLGAGLLDELINRDHFRNGYRDGYEYADPAFIDHYRGERIAEATHLLQVALSELRNELCEVRSHAEHIGLLTDPYLLHTVNTHIKRLVMQEERLIDELVATEESRGRLGLALQRYRDGFIRGFKDRTAEDDPVSRYGV